MMLKQEMITVDCAEPRELADWWAGVLGVHTVQDYGDFVMVHAEPVVLGFQRVPEAKTVKKRVHVDFSSQPRATAVERLVELGATVPGEHSLPSPSWTVLQDPSTPDHQFYGMAWHLAA